MDKNKIIIVALIVVIVALLVGFAAMMPNTSKQDTNLTFKGKSTLTEGDSLKVKLTDANGTALANQTVNITITEKNDVKSYYSVKTNENGTATLKLEKSPGKYNVTVKFAGNKKYNACYTTKRITIEEKVVATQTTSSSSSGQSSSQSSSWTDSDGENHFYKNGQEYVGDPNAQHMDIDTWNYVKEHGMK